MEKVIKTIKIGKLSLKNNVFLAPMEGFTNVAFRKGVQKTGVGCLFTEMIPASALSKDSNYCNDLLKRTKETTAYQLFSANVSDHVKSIHNLGNLPDIININCGCPAEKIISQGAGCALMRRKSRIYDIVKAIRSETDKPISIKIRKGYNKDTHLDYDKLYSFGCDAIFIHSRTCKDKYSGSADLDFLKEAKELSPIPIIGNGDICNYNDIKEMKEKTNVDGYMIGRASLHNPYIFKDILSASNYQMWATTMNLEEKLDFLRNYYKDLKRYKIKGDFVKVKSLGLFMLRYINKAKKFREKLVITKNFNNFEKIWEEIIDYNN